MISKAATLVLALAASLPFALAQCSRSYTVKVGDTCDGISANQSVSSYQLAANNPSINSECTNLQAGQVICLGTEGEDCTDTLVIESGDTCDELISCADINGTIFFHNNPNVNDQCSNLYVGQVVCVASQVSVPPMGAAEPSSAPSGSAPSGSSAPPAPSAPPASSVPAAPVNVAPSPSVQSTPSASASPTPTPSPSVHSSAPSSTPSDGGDDGDLPFCDELEDEDEEDNWN